MNSAKSAPRIKYVHVVGENFFFFNRTKFSVLTLLEYIWIISIDIWRMARRHNFTICCNLSFAELSLILNFNRKSGFNETCPGQFKPISNVDNFYITNTSRKKW